MKLKLWLSVLVSVVFIWLAFRKINYNELWSGLAKADYIYLLPAILINIVQIYLRALRWGCLIEPVKKMGPYNLFSATAIGFMANNILPARLGEFIKAYAIGKKESVSVSASFATIIVERILDLLTVFIFMFLVFYAVDLPYESAEVEKLLKYGGGILSLIFLVILILIFYFKNNKELFKNIANKVIKPISLKAANKMSKFLDAFASGLSVLKRGKHLIPITFQSFIIWVLSAVPIYLILISFGYMLPFSVSLFILVVLSLAVAIPSAPGFIGTFHYACALGLGLFNIPEEEALSVAIILHAISFFPITLIGLYFLWRSNMTLREVENLEEIK